MTENVDKLYVRLGRPLVRKTPAKRDKSPKQRTCDGCNQTLPRSRIVRLDLSVVETTSEGRALRNVKVYYCFDCNEGDSESASFELGGDSSEDDNNSSEV
jgi:RNase P subunit RPR2